MKSFLKKGVKSLAKDDDQVIQAIGFFGGNSAKGNFDVELKMKFPEQSTPNALQFVAGIGQRLRMVASIADVKIKLGVWSVSRISIDRDLQTTVVFKSTVENAFVNSLPQLMVDEEEITIKAKIEGPL